MFHGLESILKKKSIFKISGLIWSHNMKNVYLYLTTTEFFLLLLFQKSTHLVLGYVDSNDYIVKFVQIVSTALNQTIQTSF